MIWMAVASDDIKFRISGGSANTTVNNSLGGFMSLSKTITDNTANNLWDDVTGAEANAGDTEYRAFFVRNSATQQFQSATAWVSQTTPAGDTKIWFGFDGANVSKVGNTYWMPSVTAEGNAPANVSFVNSSTEATSVSWNDGTSNLEACSVVGVWVKRVVDAAAVARAADYWSLEVKGDTAA